MTKRYTHFHDEQIRDAMSKLDDALEAAAPEKEQDEC